MTRVFCGLSVTAVLKYYDKEKEDTSALTGGPVSSHWNQTDVVGRSVHPLQQKSL